MRATVGCIPFLLVATNANATSGLTFGLILVVWYSLIGMFTAFMLFVGLLVQMLRKIKNGKISLVSSSISTMLGGSIIGLTMPLFSFSSCLINSESRECLNSVPRNDTVGQIVLLNILLVILLVGVRKSIVKKSHSGG